jgi:predicted nucleotidyltransferase
MRSVSAEAGSSRGRFSHLDSAVDRLVERLHPEKIILFGSHARGTQSRASDLDLFIVQETNRAPLARIAEAMRHIPELPFAVDVIVYRADELPERRDSPFIRRLIEEGVVLYDRDNNR